MSHMKEKVEWCLRKAEKEGLKHRGLVKRTPDPAKAREHIRKAEHYLAATQYLKQGDFSDISASTLFYAMYHCLLAILVKHGYESRNQECTFALIYSLIEDNAIDCKREMIDKIGALNTPEQQTIVDIREQYQYGIDIKLKDQLYKAMLALAQEVLIKTKEILEATQ